MKLASKAIVVLVTVATQKNADKIAKVLLEKRLAACVNIIPGLRSFFHWKGKIERTEEFLMIIKTKKSYFSSLEKLVKANHSYSVPELISLPITDGSADYLNWLLSECSPKLSKK